MDLWAKSGPVTLSMGLLIGRSLHALPSSCQLFKAVQFEQYLKNRGCDARGT